MSKQRFSLTFSYSPYLKPVHFSYLRIYNLNLTSVSSVLLGSSKSHSDWNNRKATLISQASNLNRDYEQALTRSIDCSKVEVVSLSRIER